jgi:ADP-ribose pyrophosphatase
VQSKAQPKFGNQDVEIIGEEIAYQGFHTINRVRLKHRLYKGGWSEVIDREVSDRGSAASVVAYDPSSDSVCLVEQFRVATKAADKSPWSLEIVAGMIDKESESPNEVVLRELVEEAGLVPDYLEKITSYWVSPGGSSARMYIYVALCDLSGAGGIYGLDDEQEDILAVVVPRESVYQSALADETGNAATLIGLQWLTMNRERMYHIWHAKDE